MSWGLIFFIYPMIASIDTEGLSDRGSALSPVYKQGSHAIVAITKLLEFKFIPTF